MLLDKVILDLFGLFITAIGIFAVLKKLSMPALNAPELRDTLWGSNPFTLKKDIVDETMTKFYTMIALSGFFIQGLSVVISSDYLAMRAYSQCTYILVFIGTAMIAPFFTKLIGTFASLIAKRRWLPKIVESQRPVYQAVKEALDNDGLRDDQVKNRSNYSDENLKKAIQANNEQIEGRLKQLESILETENRSGNYRERLNRLDHYFE